MKTILVFLFLVLFLSCPSWAEIYEWTDEAGTIHFTTDPATIPEKCREKDKDKLTEEDTLTPQEKIEKTRQDDQRTRSDASAADDATKTAEQKRRREYLNFCRGATLLRNKIERAQAQYSAYSTRKDGSPPVLQNIYNEIVSTKKQLQDLEEKASKDGIPPGWLQCQFE